MQKYTLQESGTNHGHKLVRRNKFYLQNKKSSSSSKKKTHKTDQVYVVKDITFLCFPLSRFRIWSPWTTTLAKKTSTSVSQWLSSYYYYLGTTYPPQGWPKGGGGGGLLQTVIKSYWVDNWDLMMIFCAEWCLLSYKIHFWNYGSVISLMVCLFDTISDHELDLKPWHSQAEGLLEGERWQTIWRPPMWLGPLGGKCNFIVT